MEYMRLDGFMGGLVSRFINKALENKFGENPGVKVNEFSAKEVSVEKQNDTIEVSVVLRMPKEDFQYFIEEVTK